VGLAGYVDILRRRWIPLVLCVLVGLGAGLYEGHHGAKVYQATSRAIVNTPASPILQEALAGAQLTNSLTATYATLASSQVVAKRVVDDLGLPESAGQLRGSVHATVVPNTFIIAISASDTDPAKAANVANAVAKALGDEVSELRSGSKDDVSVKPLDQAGVPGTPTSPRSGVDLAVGLALGLLAGILLVAAMEALDRRVRSTRQADNLLNAPLLGVVPNRKSNAIVALDEQDLAGEPYRAIATSLRFLNGGPSARTVVISSPEEGEGKSTLTANLAVALASAGLQVIAVDADLRRGRLSQLFGAQSRVGLTSVISGELTAAEGLQQWHPNLRVLPTGPLPPNPSGVLGSQAAADTVAALGEMADIVLIDGAPLVPLTDTLVLSTQTDGVVLAVRHERTTRPSLVAAKRQMELVTVPLLGYVYTGNPGGVPDYQPEPGRAATAPAT
jgi:polysaccharide biosynthesis transport protein